MIKSAVALLVTILIGIVVYKYISNTETLNETKQVNTHVQETSKSIITTDSIPTVDELFFEDQPVDTNTEFNDKDDK